MLINQQQFLYFSPFLQTDYYNHLEEYVYSKEINWEWVGHTLYSSSETLDNDSFFFGHTILHNDLSKNNKIWNELIESIEKQFDCTIVRMRLNLYPNQNKKIITTPHYDMQLLGESVPDTRPSIIIMNFTTCNGGTKIDQMEVSSVRNSAVLFSNIHKHSGIVQTDKKRRICANIVTYPKTTVSDSIA
jgi:hypothetical protein